MHYSALAKRFFDNGYLIVDEFFDAAETDEIALELREHIAGLTTESVAHGHVVYEPNGNGKIRNIFHLHQANPYFDKLAASPRFAELARAIFDDEPVLVSVELFGKPAKVGSEVPYHQDNAYFNLVPDQAFTCWVALADATEQNGCVRYIEASHKLGNLPHHASGVKGNSMRLSSLPADAGREISGIVRRGGALIHHCNTIHRSEPNASDDDRPGLLFVFKAARCKKDESLAAEYNAARSAETKETANALA